MNIYTQKQRWKFLLFIAAVIIGISSLYYTNILVKRLALEEQKKIELWAEATRQLADISLQEKDFSFLLQVIQNNQTIPVILADERGNIIGFRNLDSLRISNDQYLQRQLTIMKEEHEPIVIVLGEQDKNYIYYKNSIILQQLTWYPYIQFGVILLFILVSYFAFSVSRKAEQDKVWVGLTKETAHQLGTPTSSLLAWIELLKGRGVDDHLVSELEKDVKRLEKITERFSKVGSKPKLQLSNVNEVVGKAVEYLQSRSSAKVEFIVEFGQEDIHAPLNSPLLEWVIENICKNAMDAIEGSGVIRISIKPNDRWIVIDIKDNGKGIPKSALRHVFKPGFTTKERGWGLGLSLSKRIIEEYHHGRIFVSHSELNKGTTFRIMLRK
jgi:signal transduction histidine kinase